MQEENTPVILMDLPTTVRGFVCLGEDFNPVIIINARMSAEQQKITYIHEKAHLDSGELWDETYDEYGAS